MWFRCRSTMLTTSSSSMRDDAATSSRRPREVLAAFILAQLTFLTRPPLVRSLPHRLALPVLCAGGAVQCLQLNFPTLEVLS